MAQQGWQPGEPLHIKPIIIKGGTSQPQGIGEGGGYIGSGNGWGPQEGPRRGEGGPSSINYLNFPSIVDDLLGEQRANQQLMEAQYKARFATITADTERELLDAQHNSIQEIDASDQDRISNIKQATAFTLIASKKARYEETTPKLFGLYGQTPHFLMEQLVGTRLNDIMHGRIRDSWEGTNALYDSVWRSTLELKALSLEMEILVKKLPELAKQRYEAQAAISPAGPEWAQALNEHMIAISQELDIHVLLLPEFLQMELVAAAGSVVDLTPVRALEHYKAVLEQMAATKISEIRPIDPPNTFKRGGLTWTEPSTNPNMMPPFSKPELEGLDNLIRLQKTTSLGVRWLSHHEAVLKTESARHLSSTARAFGELAERATKISDEQSRVAIHLTRLAHTFRAQGAASASQTVFMTSAGTIAAAEGAAVTLRAAISAAMVTLGELAASTASGLFVGVSALVYSPKLGNGELPERFALGTPVSTFVPGLDTSTITSAVNATLDLPFRMSSKTAADGRSEVFVVSADGVSVPRKVNVVAAAYDPVQKVYTVTTDDIPPRTLTWTPIVNPTDSSTSLPAEQAEPPVYAGATVTPVLGRIDSFPEVGEASFDDFITVFPADSGLPPIYVMFRDRREDPGVATGLGQPVTSSWLAGAYEGEGAPIPSPIADQLRGQQLKNFKSFRETFWKAVAQDSELAPHFDYSALATMKNGRAPIVKESDQRGKRIRFELHHKIYISANGEVYGIDNIAILTPKNHINTHKEQKR